MSLSDRTPRPIQGVEVADLIRSIVTPSGYLSLQLLQDIRPVVAIPPPVAPVYAVHAFNGAVAAEVNTMFFEAPPDTDVILESIQWRQAATAGAVSVRLLGAVAGVISGGNDFRGVQLEVPARLSRATLFLNNAVASAGTVLRRTDIPVGEFVEVGVPGLHMTAGSIIRVETDTANEGVTANVRWSEAIRST